MTSGNQDLDARAFALFDQSLEQASDERREWIIKQAGDDHILRDLALEIFSNDQDGPDIILTGAAITESHVDETPPERIGVYKIGEKLGQGGMGAVYRAERDKGDFDHSVAIKIIKPGLLTENLKSRFQHEQQVLAQFSHANIARLFDGGTTDEGAPYIIMELIDGAPITEWVEGNKAPNETRLSLFTIACEAVSYAHQNLIIHRDITPSNVLVTAEGDIKLIDFGIAKPYDEAAAASDAAHSLGSLSFTPGFAAPERSTGAVANTLSDIYSLGKLLEALLPDTNSVPDLSAIIGKATAHNPDKRYASVDALIDDLDNYQRGFPVDARSISGTYRFKKFISRHKFGSLLVSTAMIGLITAFGVTVYQYQQAEAARQESAKRFAETRELTSFLIGDLASDLHGVPGALPVIEKVYATSSRYLDILRAAAEGDDAVKLDYAKALAQLGRVQTRAGFINLGKPEEGLAHIGKSIDILRVLDRDTPENAVIEYNLARALADYAFTDMAQLGDTELAKKLFAESIDYYNRAQKADPSNPEIWYAKLKTQITLGGNLDIFIYERGTEALEDIRPEVKEFIKEFPNYKPAKGFYPFFLRFMGGSNAKHWQSSEELPIPEIDRARYETTEADILKSAKLYENLFLENPKSNRYLYQYVEAVEEAVSLVVLNKSWTPTQDEILTAYSNVGHRLGRSGIKALIKTDALFSERRNYNSIITPLLEKSDTLLMKILPLDGDNFTHIEARFYNLKAWSLLEANFRLNLDAAENYTDQALAMVEAFIVANPEFRNAVMEIAVTLTEKANIQLAKQTLYGDDFSGEICLNLDNATERWNEGERRWGKISDYKKEVLLTAHLRQKADCT